MSTSLCIHIPWESPEEIPLYDGMDLIKFLIKRFQPADHIINILGPPGFDISEGNCLPPVQGSRLDIIKHALEKIDSERVLILGADQPRVLREFTDYIQTLPDYYDIIIPGGMRYRPAIYNRNCIQKINSLDPETATLEDLCNASETRYISVDEIFFYDDPDEMFLTLKSDENLQNSL